MNFTAILGFCLTSIIIILGLIFINFKSLFIPKKESIVVNILINMCKIFILCFLMSLNYSLFYGNINFTSILLSICKILSILVLLVYLCKIIIFKHFIIYNNDVISKKSVTESYIQGNKLIIKTNNKEFNIDVDDNFNINLL